MSLSRTEFEDLARLESKGKASFWYRMAYKARRRWLILVGLL